MALKIILTVVSVLFACASVFFAICACVEYHKLETMVKEWREQSGRTTH